MFPLGWLDEHLVRDTAGEGCNIAAHKNALRGRQRAVGGMNYRCGTLNDTAVHLYNVQGTLRPNIRADGDTLTGWRWALLHLHPVLG